MNDTNRVIKFRAWDQDEKQMIPDRNGWLIEIDGSDTRLVQWDSTISVDRPILMQYTGLKDKNGTEIYEGDIFGIYHLGEYLFDGTVIFDDDLSAFTIERSNGGFEYLSEYLSKNVEVIGNIYENTELSPTPDEGNV